MQIEKIEKKGKKYLLTIGEKTYEFCEDAYKKCYVFEGKELTETELADLLFENEKTLCLNKGIDYISRGLKTKMQVILNLKGKKFGGKAIAYAIDVLERYGYVDDKRYAEAYISSYQKTKGKIYIKNQLRAKGVTADIIDDLLDKTESQFEQAYAVCEKYLRRKEKTIENLSKAFKYVLQHGFTYEEAESATRRIKDLWNE